MNNLHQKKVSELNVLLLEHNIDIKNIKGTGKNGNVIKIDLINAFKNNDSFVFPVDLTDVLPYIIQHLPFTTQREINKKYNIPLKTILYRFIIDRIDYNIGRGIFNYVKYFDTTEALESYQLEIINELDNEVLRFYCFLMYLINIDAIEMMDKHYMTPFKLDYFFFCNNKLVLHTNYKKAEGKISTIKNGDITTHIHLRCFIKYNFNQYDLDRMCGYYKQKNLRAPSYETVINYQRTKLQNASNNMIQFLTNLQALIQGGSIDLLYSVTFKASGFMFLDGKLVIFCERY